MSNKSFAEILNEFTTHKSANSPFTNTSSSSQSATQFNQEQSIYELNQLEILRKNAASEKSTERIFKFKQTRAYHSFSAKGNTPASKKYAKLESKTTIEVKKRTSGKPHKLNETQQSAFSYFINNHEFLLEDFTKEELRKSFKKLCFKKHPDSPGGSHQSFLELKKHYDQLTAVLQKAA